LGVRAGHLPKPLKAYIAAATDAPEYTHGKSRTFLCCGLIVNGNGSTRGGPRFTRYLIGLRGGH
jgi:hypothetical protein